MTADAAAAEPVTSNDTTSNDLAGEHVTGDETAPRTSVVARRQCQVTCDKCQLY